MSDESDRFAKLPELKARYEELVNKPSIFRRFWWWFTDKCVKCGGPAYSRDSGRTIGCRHCNNTNCRKIYYLVCATHGREGFHNKIFIS